MSLRDIVNAATPGPWRWAGSLRGWMDLCTVDRGRIYVMGFKRHGMQGAQPTFQVNGWMVPASQLAVREAEHRDDIARIDHPDAEFIATFDPTTVGRLLDVVDAARAVTEEWHRRGDHGCSVRLQSALSDALDVAEVQP